MHPWRNTPNVSGSRGDQTQFASSPSRGLASLPPAPRRAQRLPASGRPPIPVPAQPIRGPRRPGPGLAKKRPAARAQSLDALTSPHHTTPPASLACPDPNSVGATSTLSDSLPSPRVVGPERAKLPTQPPNPSARRARLPPRPTKRSPLAATARPRQHPPADRAHAAARRVGTERAGQVGAAHAELVTSPPRRPLPPAVVIRDPSAPSSPLFSPLHPLPLCSRRSAILCLPACPACAARLL